MVLSTTGQPRPSPNRETSTGSVTRVKAGTAAPIAETRLRITSLSWACRSASGAGWTVTPSSTSARTTDCGTCSWSKVTTVQPAANARTASRSSAVPRHTSAHTSAAGSPAWAASTRSDCPSAIADWWVMRASCPAPTMPTTGRTGPDSRVLTVRRAYLRLRRIRTPRACPARPVVAPSGTIDRVAVVESVLRHVPQPYRDVAIRHREMVKFALVGGTTWIIDTTIFLLLKSTVLVEKPLTAKVIAVVIATMASYVLNREWSFRTRGGRERHQEAALFFVISAIGVAVYTLPLAISRYVLDLKVPAVDLLTQNVADFVSGQIIGVMLGMAFRWWAFRRYVFPHENVRRQVPAPPG